jgi:hypothetical protein
LLAGNAPEHWWFDPSRVNYVGGCCAPDSWIREMVHRVIQSAGVSALMVSDKPDLERQLMEFARTTDLTADPPLSMANLQRFPKCA